MKTRIFESIEARDRFLGAEFPERKCAEEPGLYVLPGGGSLLVFQLEVSWDRGLIIKRDGVEVATAADTIDAIAWLLRAQPQSYDWALKHDGYSVVFEDGTPALTPYSR